MRTKAILGSLGVATAGVLTVGAFAFAGPALADAGNDNLRASHRMELTDEQRQCLADAGVTRPEGRPTDEQREAMKAAAEGCGIEVPEPGEGRGPGGPGGSDGSGGSNHDGARGEGTTARQGAAS